MKLPDCVPTLTSTANTSLQKAIQSRLDDLTKPQGSLGRLEEIALQYCLCRKEVLPSISRLQVLTFAGDHGITEENITPFPREVTPQMVLNMVTGGAAVSVMCRTAGIDYHVVDMGVDFDFGTFPQVLSRKVRPGTRNFVKEAAMTEEECRKAIQTGCNLAGEWEADLFGIGEMGIGNSSSASALYSLFLDKDVHVTVGPGTGSHGALLEKKRRVLDQALALHRKEWDGSALDALRRVGGYEIAGMVGLILGSAERGVPVVVDGFIAGSAALVAMRAAPLCREYLFFSHSSSEPFHQEFLALEGIRPLLNLDMRLGEGTGSVLAIQVIRQAMACYREMATFSSAGVSGAK